MSSESSGSSSSPLSILLKILGFFCLAWIIWYLTGGPLRATNKYPLVKFTDTNGAKYATSSRH